MGSGRAKGQGQGCADVTSLSHTAAAVHLAAAYVCRPVRCAEQWEQALPFDAMAVAAACYTPSSKQSVVATFFVYGALRCPQLLPWQSKQLLAAAVVAAESAPTVIVHGCSNATVLSPASAVCCSGGGSSGPPV